MPSNLNSLLIAWALTIIAFAGGFTLLQLNHHPAEHETAATSLDDDASASSENDAQTGTETPYNNGEITTLPQPVLADDANDTSSSNGALAPGETVSPTVVQEPKVQVIKAPNPDLLEDSNNGPLPRIGITGLMPAEYYSAPAVQSSKPKIALLMTDLGSRANQTRRALANLPEAVSLAFSPYSANLETWTNDARQAGHEFFLMVPMEPVNYPQNDPGPLGLFVDYSDRENINLLRAAMGQTTGYVGLVNHMGSRFTASQESLRPVLNEIQSRGLAFIDSRSTRYTRAAKMAATLNMAVAMNDRYIDNAPIEDEIIRQLRELENRATSTGVALGFARPYTVSVNAINIWKQQLEARGFELVPVTSIIGFQPIK